jgi:simple sugar transport system permease protein
MSSWLRRRGHASGNAASARAAAGTVGRTAMGVAASVAVPLLAIAAMALALGGDPLAALQALVDGAVGGRNLGNLQATLDRAGMVVGAALAAWVAMRAGFLNIGVEGQMVLGGVTAAALGLSLPAGLGGVAVPVVLAGAALAGAALALVAALLHLRLGVPLLVGTLLLNYPASSLASWLVNHPLRDPMAGMAASARVPAGVRLPALGASNVHAVALAVVLGLILAAWWYRRTAAGYEARMTGLGPRFALASGVPVARLEVLLMAASGAVGGLVGALAVLGEHHRYIDGMLVQPLHAWTGLMAVLLGGRSVVRMAAVGLGLAALATGAMGMERAVAMPRELARVVMAVILLVVAARGGARLGKRSAGAAEERTP